MDRTAARLYRAFTDAEARRLILEYAPEVLDTLSPIVKKVIIQEATNFLQSQGQSAVKGLTRYIQQSIQEYTKNAELPQQATNTPTPNPLAYINDIPEKNVIETRDYQNYIKSINTGTLILQFAPWLTIHKVTLKNKKQILLLPQMNLSWLWQE